ncbi:MAG: DUF177 domain-containing protein [Prevotella sp.]|nr:DUF177 domain-containing protein [Prevotella sp.]
MCYAEALKIDLRNIAEEESSYSCELGDEFFNSFAGADVKGGAMHCDVSVRKRRERFEIRLGIAGSVKVLCDRCLEEMVQPVSGEETLFALLGSETADDGETIVVGEREGVLDLTWFVYEMVILAIPISHSHAAGECNPEMESRLEELEKHGGGTGGTLRQDPRWSGLDALKDEGRKFQ